MVQRFWLPLIMVLLAMVFALIALMYIVYWMHYVKSNKKKLLKKMQRKGLFGKTFIHPGVYFEYCMKKDKLDDEKTAFYKIMFVISFMLWLLFFLISFVVYVVWR